MIGVEDLRKGVTFRHESQIWRVLEYTHVKQGRGGATIRIRARNIRTGSTVEKTFPSGNKVEDISLDHHEMTYLYHDGNFYFFMDTESYEQRPLTEAVLGDYVNYLKESLQIKVSFFENDPVDVEFPSSVDLKVVESLPGVRGDTAANTTKPATLESGYKCNVPLFVQEGDTIRVNTSTGQYVTRV